MGFGATPQGVIRSRIFFQVHVYSKTLSTNIDKLMYLVYNSHISEGVFIDRMKKNKLL